MGDAEVPFEQSVFVNCPFDDEYAPILQAIAFCIYDLGFTPRLAPENSNAGAGRLQRILELIQGSKFAIHDLSRCKAEAAGEYYRLNMPFELGLDHAAANFGDKQLASKSILVLEEVRYDFQKSLSDISGWDIEAHNGDQVQAVRKVRNWLVQRSNGVSLGADRILRDYQDFQIWHWKRELAQGASEDEIREYPAMQFVRAMQDWVLEPRKD